MYNGSKLNIYTSIPWWRIITVSIIILSNTFWSHEICLQKQNTKQQEYTIAWLIQNNDRKGGKTWHKAYMRRFMYSSLKSRERENIHRKKNNRKQNVDKRKNSLSEWQKDSFYEWQKTVNMNAYLKQQQTDKRMFAGISHYEKKHLPLSMTISYTSQSKC